MMTEKFTQKDYELINSYLDQELDRKEVLKFAERMAENPELNREVADLMKVKAMVKELPTVSPPRNYILTRAMAEEARPKPFWERLFPVFRTAAAFCALALAFTFLFPLFRQSAAPNKTQAPAAKSVEMEPMMRPNAAEESAPVAKALELDSPDFEEAAESDVPVNSMEMDYEEVVESDVPVNSMEMDYEEAAESAAPYWDEEIILEDRNFSAGTDYYAAVMPSYGVMGGNPRIEYMMRMEEQQRVSQEIPLDPDNPPEGFISVAAAEAAQRNLVIKIVLGAGLIFSMAGIFVLSRRKKALEVS